MATQSRHMKSITAGYMDEQEVRQELVQLKADTSFNTESSYSANGEVYPDHQIPFVEKHLAYLKKHPKVDPKHYISNLRLMLRIRR